jgi:hypothetical protein
MFLFHLEKRVIFIFSYLLSIQIKYKKGDQGEARSDFLRSIQIREGIKDRLSK